MSKHYPVYNETGRAIAAGIMQQNGLIAKIANAQAMPALLDDWTQVVEDIREGLGDLVVPVGSHIDIDYLNSANDTTHYDARWDFMHHGHGTLADGETIPVAFMQMHNCLPFDTEFSPRQAFLTAITVIPAGTYYVTFGSKMGDREAGDYHWTLTQDLPIGGQLTGFDNYAGNSVKAWASATATTATETCTVTAGAEGTCLGTFTAEGVSVPASGTPTVTTVGSLQFYGLNSVHRVAYGNNRWLHSPLRQFLNATGKNWWAPKTVFDRPPAYASYTGFLSGLPEDFVESMQPIAQVTALNYITDGGTAASPVTDTTYDKVFLPSWEQHFLAVSQSYGGSAHLEGVAWDQWRRTAGSASPFAAGTTNRQYIQYDLASPTTARTVWMRSAYRGSGSTVAYVNTSGYCGGGSACHGLGAAPACAIG